MNRAQLKSSCIQRASEPGCLYIAYESLAEGCWVWAVNSSAVRWREIHASSQKSARAKTSGTWTGHQQNLPQCALHLLFLSHLPPLSSPLWTNPANQPPRTLQINFPGTGRAWSGFLPFLNIFNASIRKDLYKREPRGQNNNTQGWIPLILSSWSLNF